MQVMMPARPRSLAPSLLWVAPLIPAHAPAPAMGKQEAGPARRHDNQVQTSAAAIRLVIATTRGHLTCYMMASLHVACPSPGRCSAC